MRFLFVASAIVGLSSMSLWAASEIDAGKMEALKPRMIGPATMSGRATAITVDPRDANVIYAGTASGGLWRSRNGGINWQPIFEDQDSASIGAVAVDRVNPDVIWVGTGEGNPRNSQSVGTGIYKSLDGGRTWERQGLEKSEHIHRVLIHPSRSEVVYACAVGPTWSDGDQRGVFKTSDGGKTWRHVLAIDEKTGCADMVMDASNPDKLIVATWEHRRTPWDFQSGGPGSGIHVTYDGGEHWTKKTHEDGLPKGNLGRIGLAIADSAPNVVYALVEAKKNALYRSEDGGHEWKKISDKPGIGNRPFYYFDIYLDPSNENRIYSLHGSVTMSEDGGRSFTTLVPFSKVHSDHHAFWIDPDDTRHLMVGNDGGLAISRDMGETWSFVENLPVGQFYHISVDNQQPYNVYGGLQDNGSFRGPGSVWAGGFGGGGIRNSQWQMISFGDGFDVVPDRDNDRYGFSMSQGGMLYRWDLVTHSNHLVRPTSPDGSPLRFNWNAGIGADPFDPATIYYGSQFLHRSRDRGRSWDVISPDLTTNNPDKQKQLDSGGLTYDVTGAENHTTIVAVAPSPVQKDVIWVGTDDGNVQVTRDGGKNWSNVVGNIPGVPEATWVPHIEASKFKAGSAFVVFDDHRRGNWTPYVFQTNDYGRTWTSLAGDDLEGFVYVIEQDNKEESLLFLGTEFHLYFSLDGGQSWHQWESGYPTVPTRDLVVHPRDDDLVIGTFGRAIWILDDISPLRALARDGLGLLDEPLKLVSASDAVQAALGSPPGELIPGAAAFSGENRPFGSIITYVFNPDEDEDEEADTSEAASNGNDGPADDDVPGPGDKKEKKDKVKIEVLDGDQVIRKLDGTTKPGFNRVTWRLDRKGPRRPGRQRRFGGGGGGISVAPGEYTVRVSFGERQDSTRIKVSADPRLQLSKSDIEARQKLIDDYAEVSNALADASEQLSDAKKNLERVQGMAKDAKGKAAEALRRQGKDVASKLKGLQEQLRPAPVQGIRRDPNLVTSQLFLTGSYVRGNWEAPTPNERHSLKQLKQKADLFLKQVEDFFKNDWEKYKKAVDRAKLPLITDKEKKRKLSFRGRG